MAGYLDQYGAGDARREKIVKTAGLALAAVLVVGGILFFLLHNYRQEQQVKRFFGLLAAQDFKSAYGMWGCTDTKPCRDYPFTRFMEDWGPQNGRMKAPGEYRITRSRSCGSGVIMTVKQGSNQEYLWVQRDDLTIEFPPYEDRCPTLR